jgi:hypothetical protein
MTWRLWAEAEHLTGTALRACARRAAVQKLLKAVDLHWRLEHSPITPRGYDINVARSRSRPAVLAAPAVGTFRGRHVPRLTRFAALLGRPADPGGEQVTETDHAVDAPPFHDRQVAEAVQEHDLGRVLDRRIRAR